MSDVLQDAQRLYQEALEAMDDQREQVSEDLVFSDPSDPRQWDDEVKRLRESDPGGKRPCLVMDQTGQYVANVAGQVEQSPPAIHAIPVGGGADKKAAEQIDGRFRHIEHASRSSQHYARALTSAARTGVGYLVVRPEYVDRSLGWQEPRIGSVADPLEVVFDPWSIETDGSDSTYAFMLSPMSRREFERRWKDKEQHGFGEADRSRNDDDRESILVAEQWLKEDRTEPVVVYLDENGEEQTADTTLEDFSAQVEASGMPLQILRTYKDKRSTIKWRRMSGADILEESEYPADSIGIVPVYGYVGFADGRMRYCGIPRRARVPQQAYNYHVSEQLAYMGTAPKSPWIVSKRAARGVEEIWDNSSRESRGWLPFNDVDDMGAIASPSRINTATNLVNHQAGAEQALKDIQASIGMYQANLGAPSNEQSGVAIESRKQQGEASTAHFPSHLSASLGQVGRIVMQMDARLSDSRRKQPIIGADQSPGTVMVDPEQSEAFQRVQGGDVSINPRVGKYGVRVVIGPSYSTQRTQNNAAFTEMMRGNPSLVPAIAPFWAQTLDVQNSDKLAQALTAMAPDPVKAILQPEGGDKGPDPAMLAKQLAETKAALQEAIQHAHAAQEDADKAIASEADAKRLAEVRERELDIQAYNAETARLKITGANDQQIQAIVTDLVNQMLSSPDPLPGDPMPAEQPMPQMGGMEAMPEEAEPVPEMQEPAGMPEPQEQPPGMGDTGM